MQTMPSGGGHSVRRTLMRVKVASLHRSTTRPAELPSSRALAGMGYPPAELKMV
jgi:hypothetical protein